LHISSPIALGGYSEVFFGICSYLEKSRDAPSCSEEATAYPVFLVTFFSQTNNFYIVIHFWSNSGFINNKPTFIILEGFTKLYTAD
jgi:hypothetical protein